MKRILILALCMGLTVPALRGLASAADAAPAAPGAPAAPVAPKESLKVGDAMVDVKAPDGEGKVVALSGVLGKKATAVIWAQSACSVCRMELSKLGAIQKEFPDVGFVVAMVDVMGKETAGQQIERYGVEKAATVLYDKEFDTGKPYGVYHTPYVVIIKDGKVIERIADLSPREDYLVKALKAL